MTKMIGTTLLAGCAMLLLTPLATATPLAERVPADAILYVGTVGGEQFAAAAEGTPAGALLAASNLPAVADVVLPNLADALALQDPEAGAVARQAVELFRAAADKPAALYFGGLTTGDDGQPIPKIGLIIDAGNDAPALRQKLAVLLQQTNSIIGLALTRLDEGRLLVYVGYTDLEIGLTLAGDEGASLADADSFARAMGEVRGEGAQAALYVDAAKLRELIDSGVAEGDDEEAKRNWPILKEFFGLETPEALAWSGRFGTDGMWHVRRFLAAPAPRQGLLGLLDGPADAGLLAAAPKGATEARLVHFDAAGLLPLLNRAMAAADPQAGDQNYRQGLMVLNLFVGADVQRDVLDKLGKTWLVYQSPDVADGPAGWVAVNRLDDPMAMRQALTMLSFAAVNAANSQAQPGGPRLIGRRATIDGVDVFHTGTPLASLSWAIEGDRLYAGFYPQTVAAAAKLGGGLDESEAVNAALELAGGGELRAVRYYDLPATAAETYTPLLALAQSAVGFGDLFGGDPARPLLPTLPTVKQHLTPAHGATWADDAGLHRHDASPFPLATLLPTGDEILLIGTLGNLVAATAK